MEEIIIKKTIILIIFIIILSLYYFNINIKEEELIFNSFEGEYKQGGYVEIIVDNVLNHDLKLVTNIADQLNNKFYRENNKLYAYIPISITKEINDYTIKIYDDGKIVKVGKIKVVEGDFFVQNLRINQSIVAKTQTKEAYEEYKEALDKARSYNFKERFFEDKFIMPIEGKISTEFGVKRYINGSNTPVRHYGIDIVNESGTPVKAVASGKVVFADYLITSGNYIIIDHGMGIFSYYAHLDSISINLFDFVKQGDIIGYVGSTGFSTGPHLHFNITFMETSVNPWPFIEKKSD